MLKLSDKTSVSAIKKAVYDCVPEVLCLECLNLVYSNSLLTPLPSRDRWC